jgi:hypothetical protein
MRISREQIEQLRAALKKAPEAPPRGADTTKQEAVRLLVGEIQALQRRGYLLEQVAEMFRNGGLVLTTPTLKSYLSRAKGGQKRRRTRQRAETGRGPKAPGPAGVPPKVSRREAADREKKEAATATTSVAAAKPRPPGAWGEGSSQDGASATLDGSRLLSGKDAFRTQDKASY